MDLSTINEKELLYIEDTRQLWNQIVRKIIENRRPLPQKHWPRSQFIDKPAAKAPPSQPEGKVILAREMKNFMDIYIGLMLALCDLYERNCHSL